MNSAVERPEFEFVPTTELLLLNARDGLELALPELIKFAKLSIQFKLAPPTEILAAAESTDLIMACEDLDQGEQSFHIGMLEDLQRSGVFVPVLVLSESKSPSVVHKSVLDDLDFVIRKPIISGSDLLLALKDLCLYREKNKTFIELRKKIHHLFASKSFHEAIKPIVALGQNRELEFTSHLLAAEAWLALAEFKKALAAAEKALKMKKKSLAARRLIASIYHCMGQPEKAETILEEALSIAEDHIQCLLQLGEVVFDQGKMAKSKRIYSRVLAIDAANKAAKDGELTINLIEGQFKAAASGLKGRTANDLAKICNLKAIQLVKAGQFDSAEKLYKNVIALIPNHSSAYKLWLNLGLCMKKAGKYQKALRYFRKCKEKAPSGYDKADAQIVDMEKKLASS